MNQSAATSAAMFTTTEEATSAPHGSTDTTAKASAANGV